MATDKNNGLLKTLELIQKQLVCIEEEINDFRSEELNKAHEELLEKMVFFSEKLEEHLQ